MRSISIMLVVTVFLGCSATSDDPAQKPPSISRSDNTAATGDQAPATSSQNEASSESADDVELSAADLFSAGRYADALAAYKNRIEYEPTNQTVLYNAGQCAYLIGQYDDARASWLALEKLAGDSDLGVKEKLLQTFEQLDQPDEVERRIAELAALRQNTEDLEYKQKKSFCRDQFTIRDEQFLVHHHFDFPTGDESRFTAYCAGREGKTKYLFRFWSSETTNAIAREGGELKRGERLYHIDEYRPNGSKINHLHTKQSLSYREFKKIITGVLKARQQ